MQIEEFYLVIKIIIDSKTSYQKSLINFRKYDRISIDEKVFEEIIMDEVLIDEFVVNLNEVGKDNRLDKKTINFLKAFDAFKYEELKIMSKDNDMLKEIYGKAKEVESENIITEDLYIREHYQLLLDSKNEGINQTKINNTKNLLDVLSDEVIADKIGLDLEVVKKLREESI